MQLEPMHREFSYSGLRLADPDNRLTPEQVRDFYSTKSQNQNCLASS